MSEPATVTVQGTPAEVSPSNNFIGAAPVSSGMNTVQVQATDPSGNLRTNTYQVTLAGTTSNFTYDANGNLTADGTKTYDWDAEDRLVAVKQGATTLASYVYDGIGRRVRKTANGVVTTFINDGSDVLERRESTGVTARYIHGAMLDQHLGSQDQAGVATFFVSDHLNSVRQVTNGAGAIALSRDYDPFGNPLSGATAAGYAFTGREWEPEANVYYHRARYYAPLLGRFMNEDPIGTKGGLNLYGYARNNPVRWSDRTGFVPADPGGVVGCLAAEFMNALDQGHQHGMRYAHCMASCKTKRNCGAGPSLAAQWAKENLWDSMACLVFGRQQNCNSWDQPSDYHDNAQGYNAPCSTSCAEACEDLKDVPESAPGPHWWAGCFQGGWCHPQVLNWSPD